VAVRQADAQHARRQPAVAQGLQHRRAEAAHQHAFLVEHLANSLHLASVNSSFSSAISGTDMLVLAAWGIAAAAFAAWRFSWLPSTATA
jgi:hypothetical protein